MSYDPDKQKLGWFGTAWLLSLLLSSSAWALDFNHETSRHEADASDLSSTLGRSRGIKAAAPRVERRDGLHIVLKHKLRPPKTAKPAKHKRIAKSRKPAKHRRRG